MAKQIQRPRALGDQVVTALRSDILAGELSPGDLLVEAALAETFGVSRGPVRDALRTLAGEGLIAAAGRSYRVVGLDEKDLHDLFALRELLEVSAARQCASPAPQGFRDAAESALERMRQAAESSDAEAFAVADVDFHSAFFAFCGNQRLHAVWEQQVPTFSELFRLTTALDQPLLSTVDAHRAVLNTICDGDLEAVSAGVRELVVAGEQQIVATRRSLREIRSA